MTWHSEPMNDHELNELLHLAAMNELSPDQERALDSRLKRNPAAKKELEELKRLGALIALNAPAPLPETVLTEARRGLRRHLTAPSWTVRFDRFHTVLREWFSPRFAVTGAAALALGVLIGYCSFNLPEGPALSIQPASETPENTATRIENLRFIDQDGSDGEVEFEFDAVAPVRLKGRIDDPEVQRILTHAMLNESNAGVRLSSMQTIAREAERSSAVDTAVVAALIAALSGDVNPGVRREALRVLQQMPFSPRIRDAFVSVVIHDRNSGLRVAAINALELARLDGNAIDRQNAESLRRGLESESNHYIRERAAHLVKEVYQ